MNSESAQAPRWRLALLAILCLAFALRVVGLTWGVPVDPYTGTYHPDEPKIIQGATAFPGDILTRTDLRYPTAYHYAIGLLALPIRAVQPIVDPDADLFLWIALLGRLCTLALAILAVLATFRLGMRWYGRPAGLTAAAFLAVLSAHVIHGAWATLDVPTSFLAILAIALADQVVLRPSWRNVFLLALTSGLLIGVKYPGGVVIVPGLLAIWLAHLTTNVDGGPKSATKSTLLAHTVAYLALCAVVVLLTTPAILLHPQNLLDAVRYESGRQGLATMARFTPDAFSDALDALGTVASWPMALLFAMATLWAVVEVAVKRAYRPLLVLALLVPYYLVLGDRLANRYLIMVLPLYCLLAGGFLAWAWQTLGARAPRLRLAPALLGALVWAAALAYTGWTLQLHLQPDARTEAAKFLATEAKDGSTVCLDQPGEPSAQRWKEPRLPEGKVSAVDCTKDPDYVVTIGGIGRIREALASPFLRPDFTWSSAYRAWWPDDAVPDPDKLRFYNDLLVGRNPAFEYAPVAEFRNEELSVAPFMVSEVIVYQKEIKKPKGQPEVVAFSPAGGFYDAPQQVTLTTTMEDARIRYTTDGSAPTARYGADYGAPLSITTTTILRAAAFPPDALEPADVVSASPATPISATVSFTPVVSTASYLYADDVMRQSAKPSGWPDAWDDEITDYGMDPRAMDTPEKAEKLKEALFALPTISLAVDPDDLLGPERGIYTHPEERGDDWERPVSAEWWWEDGSLRRFHVDAGLRIQGHWNRNPDKSPKHSLRLIFKKKYGSGKLKAELFPNGPKDGFDTLTLRGGFNDAWLVDVDGQRERAQYVRDEWFRETQWQMGWLSSRGLFVHVYLNGLYWGVYNIVERPDANFAAAYLGGEEEDYDVLKADEIQDGNDESWQAMLEAARSVTDTASSRAAVDQLLDVPNLIDYMLINLYAGNVDWPKRNWYALAFRGKGPVPEGESDATEDAAEDAAAKRAAAESEDSAAADLRHWQMGIQPKGFEFFNWDGERGLEFADRDIVEVHGGDNPALPYHHLRMTQAFQKEFAEHVKRHTQPGGALYVDPEHPEWDPEHPERNVPAARFVQLVESLDPAILAESARWGDYRQPDAPYTRDGTWMAEQARLLKEFFPVRTQVFVEQLRRIGLAER